MTLVPAADLAARETTQWPNESDAYRQARTALLADEIALRRQIEAVAEQRRALPPGPEVTGEYVFQGEHGPVRFADLFGRHDTLLVYTYMFGPERERPCPMCTSLLSSWDGEVPDIRQRAAFAVIARSPIDRLLAFKQARGWQHMPLYSDADGAFSRDYHAVDADGSEMPQFIAFTRRDGTIRLFWAGEMGFASMDPGQDPRGAPDLMPLWTILDATPEGRGTDWYPSLSYAD
jgi:predicted dithiol-disulfide oxidoreductase (DUF899 family)